MKRYLFEYIKNGSICPLSVIAPTAVAAIKIFNDSTGLEMIYSLRRVR